MLLLLFIWINLLMQKLWLYLTSSLFQIFPPYYFILDFLSFSTGYEFFKYVWFFGVMWNSNYFIICFAHISISNSFYQEIIVCLKCGNTKSLFCLPPSFNST